MPSVSSSGSLQIRPVKTTTYTLTANGAGGTARATATVTVQPAPPSKSTLSGVLTYHNNTARTGQNLGETALNPGNVNSENFGKLFAYGVDGPIFAQPLYVSQLAIPGQGIHNVVYVATEHDSLYAFDADGKVSSPLWRRSFIDPANGVTSMSMTDVGSDNTGTEVGITGTPVIDPDSATLYVVAATKENGSFFQRLHAIDIKTGDEKFGGPVEIKASVKGTGSANDGAGNVVFLPQHQNQRGALLLLNGVVYIIWGSHHVIEPWHGWMMAYDAETLQQLAVFNSTPNDKAGGMWQSGNGPAVDENGHIMVSVGQGAFSADKGGSSYGDSMLKFSTAGRSLNLIDYFTPHDQAHMYTYDLDLGVGGTVVLPEQPMAAHRHLALQVSKIGNVYLVDRDNMGHYRTADDGQLVQFLPQAIGVFEGGDGAGNGAGYGTPTYWNGFVYFAGVHDSLKAFRLENGVLVGPVAHGPTLFDERGGVTAVSANGATNGIVWVISKADAHAILYAYDANDVSKEIYNSDQAGSRDRLERRVKFAVPTEFNGRVYVGTFSKLVVFGLLRR